MQRKIQKKRMDRDGEQAMTKAEIDMLRLSTDYSKYQIFPPDYFKEVDGFKDFLDTGYFKYLKSLEVTPYKVLK